MHKQVLLYMPVIHAGYLKLLDRHRDAEEIWLLDESLTRVWPSLAKEIRALPAKTVARYLRTSHRAPLIDTVGLTDLARTITAESVVVPREDVMRAVVDRFGLDQGRDIVYDETFLRWDRDWSLAQRPVDQTVTISVDGLDQALMRRAQSEAQRSSDWWRQVGAVVVTRDGTVLSDHNRHLPTDYSPYLNGDPRDNFKRGLHIELSTATHGEAGLVAGAARQGISLTGSQLYVTTFPCPPCARLVAEAGITTCFFAGPYSLLDGDEVMRQAGISLIWVQL